MEEWEASLAQQGRQGTAMQSGWREVADPLQGGQEEVQMQTALPGPVGIQELPARLQQGALICGRKEAVFLYI